MTELDDEGMAKLLRGAIVQAERDAKDGDQEAMIFLAYMRGGETMSNGDTPAPTPTVPDWDGLIKRADALVEAAEARLSGKPAQSRKTQPSAAPQPEALTQEEIIDRARRLSDLGIDYQFALRHVDPTKRAADEKAQARRDFAARLGLNPAYVTDEMVEASNG